MIVGRQQKTDGTSDTRYYLPKHNYAAHLLAIKNSNACFMKVTGSPFGPRPGLQGGTLRQA
jgi:hypothetical protein